MNNYYDLNIYSIELSLNIELTLFRRRISIYLVVFLVNQAVNSHYFYYIFILFVTIFVIKAFKLILLYIIAIRFYKRRLNDII